MKHLNEELNRIAKLTYCGNCLWNNCSSTSIKSHSHTKNILKNISYQQHVYGINLPLVRTSKDTIFRRISINKASVFHGFCSIHDDELFKKAEDTTLETINNEIAFLLYARAIFFEYYSKKTEAIRMNQLIKLANHQPRVYEEIKARLADIELFCNSEFPKFERDIYDIYHDSLFSKINCLSKKINKNVEISLSTIINPLFNNYIPKINQEQPIFSLHIIPFAHHSFVVISWLDQYDAYMQWIQNEFTMDFNRLINYLCFMESTDFYFSEHLYELTIQKNLMFLAKAIFNRTSFPYFGYKDVEIIWNFNDK